MTAPAPARPSRRGEAGSAANSAAAEARRAARVEDVEFLLRWEGNAQAIAHRAGFTSAATAERYMNRCGRHDLARRLHALAERCDPYQPGHAAAADRSCAA